MKFTAVVLLLIGVGTMFGQMLSIDSIDAAIGDEAVFLNTGAEPSDVGADFFNVYRDTFPIFFSTQVGPSNLLPDRAYAADYTDDFDDSFWPGYVGSSKGIGDTLVNLFYVVNAVDTAGEFMSLSNCAAEFDQGMKSSPTAGSVNFISIPTYDERWSNASDLSALGVTTVQEWHAVTQTWLTVGVEVVSGVWSPDDPLQLSHVYRVSGADIPSETIFTTFNPGFNHLPTLSMTSIQTAFSAIRTLLCCLSKRPTSTASMTAPLWRPLSQPPARMRFCPSRDGTARRRRGIWSVRNCRSESGRQTANFARDCHTESGSSRTRLSTGR